MSTPAAGGADKPLSRGQKALWGLAAPLAVLVLGTWIVLESSTGQGPSAGGRGMVLAFFGLPIALLATLLLNLGILFLPLASRAAAFGLGLVAPALALLLGHAYLWRHWPLD